MLSNKNNNKESIKIEIRHKTCNVKKEPSFRSEPWPFTGGKMRKNVGVRRIKTLNEKKCLEAVSIEGKQFVRAKRKNIPSNWDSSRDWRNDGWKEQGKKRYQWENRAKIKSGAA